MSGQRYLIVNADDLGYSRGVNRGIVEAHLCGLVTSASLMVRQPATGEALLASHSCPRLSLGLHLDLGEWAFRDGQWVELYRVVDFDNHAAVEREIGRQLEMFRELTGRKPTHLDSHQHVHRDEPARSVLRELGGQLGVPVRHETPGVSYCGAFYGQTVQGEPLDEAISEQSLIAVLESLPVGVTELGCHPGFADDRDTMYGYQRRIELATLCSPRVRAAVIELGIELLNFEDVSGWTDTESESTLLRDARGREVWA